MAWGKTRKTGGGGDDSMCEHLEPNRPSSGQSASQSEAISAFRLAWVIGPSEETP